MGKVQIEIFNGLQILFDISNSLFYAQKLIMSKIKTLSPYIFQIYHSKIYLDYNLFFKFYPQLIYATFSELSITNSAFMDSYISYGIYDIIAIKLEYNISYQIQNCLFISLQNMLNGPVIYYFFIYLINFIR